MGPRPVHYNPGHMKRLLLLPAALLHSVHAWAAPASVMSEPVVIVADTTDATPAVPPPAPLGEVPPASATSAPRADEGPGVMHEVVLQALALLGTPYRWAGQSPSGGFDCSGLVSHVVQQALGIALPRSAAAMSRIGAAIERSALHAGDLLFFVTRRTGVSHVGIYIGDGRFVHATRSGGEVRVSALGERYWSTRYAGARRIAGD